MYRVRFHLQSGKNYLKWQIRQGKTVVYVDPSKDNLEMVGCKLVNKLNKAKKVHKAGVKDVAGWVECERVMINNENPVDNLERLFYNPIRDPQWRRDSDNGEFDWDNTEYATLVTHGKQVYILEERT
jgi:ABC-type uncharacterized transport system ATPase subunit